MAEILLGNVKGQPGETGPANEVLATVYRFCASEDGDNVPSGPWTSQVPALEKGMYLWCQNTITWEYGRDTLLYTVGYFGRDGEFSGLDLVKNLEGRVQELEDRTTPISKGGTDCTTLEGIKAKFGITTLETSLSDLIKQFGTLGERVTELEKLPEQIESINDLTTGINLLRGTRDFTSGTTAVAKYGSTDLYSDGVSYSGFSNRTVYKDTDGFTVIDFSKRTSSDAAGAIYSSVVEGLTGGEQITVSVDVLVSDNLNSESRYFLTVNESNASNERVSYQDLLLANLTGSISTIEKNKWYTVKLNYTIKDPSTKFLFVALTSVGGQLLKFRKLMVQRGNINHPIWSVSPFDIDYINDETTGINLLRGTRDFAIGKTWVRTDTTYLEGFYNRNGATFSKDEEGFTVAKITRPSTVSSAYALITNSIFLPKNESFGYTLSFEFKLDRKPERDFNIASIVVVEKGNESRQIYQEEISLSKGGFNYQEIQPDTWYKFVFRGTTSNITIDNVYAYFFLKLDEENSLNLRKADAMKGHVNNPVWSASPFDVAQQADMKTVPRGYGIANDDIDNIATSGVYHYDAGVHPTGYPNVGYNFSTLIVYEVGERNNCVQLVIPNRPDSKLAVRTRWGGATWTDWRYITTTTS